MTKVETNEKKIEIVSIHKAGEGKAKLNYKEEGSSKNKTSLRTVYNKRTYDIIVFKGVQYQVKWNELGFASSVKVRGAEMATQITPEDIKVEPIQIKLPTDGAIKHKEFNTIKTCVENNVSVYLYGPAGSGKNHVLQQIAEELKLEFYFTNSVQQEYKITGFIDAGGNYHETEFYKAFLNGGLFFLDEMDASIPEVLVLLNAALANGYFEFPNGKINAHPDFRVVAAGNTIGQGADEQYAGRLQLDSATLDRFVMIEFDYDKNIELHIAKGNKELVDFIRDLRKQAKNKGISAVFSYRSITMVTKLESVMELKKVLQIAILKGMDKDTLSTLDTNPTNKYSKALWMMKQTA